MIRIALNKDKKDIINLGKELSLQFSNLYNIDLEFQREFSIIIVSENKKIDGFLLAHNFDDHVDLLTIVVDKKERGKKIGTQLMEYLINNYCFQGKNILLEVAVDNFSALKLYEKLNFDVINVRKGYYSGVDAYIMRR